MVKIYLIRKVVDKKGGGEEEEREKRIEVERGWREKELLVQEKGDIGFLSPKFTLTFTSLILLKGVWEYALAYSSSGTHCLI